MLLTHGRMLKTVSKDVEYLDEELPLDILRFLHSVIEHIAAVIIIKITTPWAILAAVPAAIILLLLGRYYLCLERRARKLESRSLNLFLTHFSDTIAGAVTIRAYQKEMYMIFHNRPFYQYGGHFELIRFKKYYGMHRGEYEEDPLYLLSIRNMVFHCIFLGKKAIIITSLHGTTIFFPITILF